MPLPALLPLAKIAAPFILKGIGKFFGNKGKKKALKEQQRSQQESIDNKFQADTNAFDNSEDQRTMQAQGIGQQLKGARALSPEVLAAAMKRRKSTAYKGSVADQTQGMDTAMIGDAIGGIGNIAGAMNRESAIANAENDSLSQASRVTTPPLVDEDWRKYGS